MTEKEKAKAYDEALKRANAVHKDEDIHLKATLERIFPELEENDNERIRKNCIHFLEWQKQHHAAIFEIEECIGWLEKEGKDKKEINNFDVLPGLYKCVRRMFDGTPDGKLLFEIDNVYKCLSKHSRAEFEVSYGHSVYLEDPVVCKYFIPFEDKGEQKSADKIEPKFKVGDKITHRVCTYMGAYEPDAVISKITEDKYILNDGFIYIIDQDSWELVPDKKEKFDPKTLKPFDRVLVRDYNDDKWVCSIFSHIESEDSFHYECILELTCRYCIPYNDDTKHLVGTTEEAPEFYRYW